MRGVEGLTLVELIVVLAVAGILLGLAAPPVFDFYSQHKVESEASKLYGDLRWAQAEAEKQGEVTLINGLLMKRRIFIALDVPNRRYSIWRWQDENGNGIPDAGEFNRELMNNPANDLPLRQRMLTDADFGFDPSVSKTGCGNGDNAPAGSIVNLVGCPSAICNGCSCIRFNGKGFYEGMNNTAIYLSNSRNSAAVNLNLAGTASMCRWDRNRDDGAGSSGLWVPIR